MNAIRELTILHSNDLHGDFLAEELDKKLVGGVSMLSGYITKERRENKNVIYAIAGDMFRGSIIDSEYKGISTIEIMNLLAPDIVTLGNHEIDYGIAHLLFIEKCAKFPIINANLFIKTNHSRLFTPYKIIEIDGMHIMFIGVITNEILAQTKNEGLIGTFIDVSEAAKEIGVICDNYKTTQIDYTVLLTHIGIEKDIELAGLLDRNWGINLIIGGHSHTLLDTPKVVNGIPIVQAGCGTDQIGKMDLRIDIGFKKVISENWTCLPIDETHCPRDESLETLILNYKTLTDKKYGRIITRFPRTLTHPTRIAETEIGNLFADLMQVDSSFDIMLYGSGSIRRDALGPILRYRDLLESTPYDDPIYMIEVTGEQLRRMILYVLRDEAYEGHTEFYQYSKGIKIVYSKRAHALESFSLNNEEIRDGQYYRIGLQNYHYKNFEEFFNIPLKEIEKNKKPRMVATSCFCILEELLMNAKNTDSKIEGRLIIKE